VSARTTIRHEGSFGSFASIHDAPVHVRFTPVSDRIADIARLPKIAKTRLMRCS